MKTPFYTKMHFLFISIIFCSHAFSQTRVLAGLVKAERDFSALSESTNTRDAFLANLDDSSLVFSKGQVQKGKEVWTAKKPNKALLTWQPDFVDVSGGADFGYTTGPWQFKKDRADAAPMAYGEYNTVWIKNNMGIWKVFADMGVSHSMPSPAAALRSSSSRAVESTGNNSETEVNAIEQKLIKAINGKGNTAKLLPFLSDESRVIREGVLPLINKDSIRAFLNAIPPQSLTYSMVGLKLASAKDMALAYGTVKLSTTAPEPLLANYMRVWKKEKDGWKLVLDVLSL